jgi:ribosome-binding ATPase YchF (GTP1/OBG family)
VDGKVSPSDDIETISTELILADLQTLENALPRLDKDSRKDKSLIPAFEAAREAQSVLESGTGAFQAGLDLEAIRDLHLLSAKRQLFVFNCDTDELQDEDLKSRMREIVAPAEAIFLDAKSEAELVELGDDEEAEAMRAEMLADMGVDEPGLDALARVGFATLGLQTYLTAGPKESRAWTIPQGATAPQAAGVIHTDFERGFIKAEIVSFDDLVEAGSMAAAKSAGKVRMEGKDYVMADGDVVEFRFAL